MLSLEAAEALMAGLWFLCPGCALTAGRWFHHSTCCVPALVAQHGVGTEVLPCVGPGPGGSRHPSQGLTWSGAGVGASVHRGPVGRVGAGGKTAWAALNLTCWSCWPAAVPGELPGMGVGEDKVYTCLGSGDGGGPAQNDPFLFLRAARASGEGVAAGAAAITLWLVGLGGLGWGRVGRLWGPSRDRHTPPISSVTGTASNRVPGPGSQHWARHSPGLPSGLTVEGMRSGPSRLDCVRAGSVMAHRGSACLVAWGSCSIYCSALTILKFFIWGRGLTLCFAMGPTNSVAVLSEEGSGQESGPMGCCLSSFRPQEGHAAGWVALPPPGRVARWASRPGLFWGRCKRADKRPHPGHSASQGRTVCPRVPRLRALGTLRAGYSPRHTLGTKLAWHFHPLTGLRNNAVFWAPG